MRYKIIGLLFIICFGIIEATSGQEILGIVNSNYAGIDGIMINPASFANSRYWLDINLVTTDFFAENNYLYFPAKDYRFSRFFQPNAKFPTYGPDNLAMLHTSNNNLKNLYADNRLLGPSVGIAIHKHSFGIFTAARTALSINHVPLPLADLIYYTLKNPDLAGIKNTNKPVKAAALSWAEFGINYAYTFSDDQDTKKTIGMSAKLLKGYGGAYLNTGSSEYMLNNPFSLDITKINLVAGYSLPLDYKTLEYLNSPTFRGNGFGFDFGFTFVKKSGESGGGDNGPLCSQPFDTYKYRFGISLLDFGKINFTNNAQAVQYLVTTTFNLDYFRLNRSSLAAVIADLSTQLYKDPKTAIKSDRISVGLPTALSVQYDHRITPDLFLNGTLVVPAKIFKNSVQRPALLAITPRYERDLFEISMPLSLYNFVQPHLGLAARLGIFFLGTDNLNGIVGLANVKGMDLYAGIKVGFRKGHCKSKASGSGGGNEDCIKGEYLKFKKSNKGK